MLKLNMICFYPYQNLGRMGITPGEKNDRRQKPYRLENHKKLPSQAGVILMNKLL